MSTITREKIDILIQKIRKQPTINNIFYFTKVLKKCLSGSDTNQEEVDAEEDFIIEESEVFDIMLKFGLTEFPQILKKIFLQHQQKKANGNPKIMNLNVIKFINNKKMEIILKVYLFNFYKFFSQLHEDDMIIYVLKRLPLISELMYVFPQLVLKIEKQVIEYWATSDVLTVKLHAFVALRKLAIQKDKSEIEQLFRKTYVTFVKNVKQMNWRNYELVIFMINCFNELLNLDFDSAYVIGFSYLRQIALQLKGETAERKEDSVKKLYNWEIINSLKVWVNILSKNDELSQLIYPLTEIIQGLIQFDKENEYIPTHLHLVRMLIDIQEKSNQFLPIFKFLKNILSSTHFSKKLQKSSHLKAFDFVLNLKVTKKHNKSTIFWNDVFKQCLDLAGLALAKFSSFPEAPEVTHHFVKFLTRLGKNLKFIVYKMQIKELLNKINENNQIVYNLRVAKGLAPNQKLAQQSLLAGKETTPLQKLAEKLLKEHADLIKQKISAEKEHFYDHKSKKSGNKDQEEDEEEEQDEEDQEQNEEDFDEEEFDEDDEDQQEQDQDDSYDFQKDVSDVDSAGDSIEKEEDYDLEEMEYEGDPDEYNSADFESGDEQEQEDGDEE